MNTSLGLTKEFLQRQKYTLKILELFMILNLFSINVIPYLSPVPTFTTLIKNQVKKVTEFALLL